MAGKFFTSESVTEGHPDKLCDQVSDAVLDAILALDPVARVACEVLATTGIIFVAGEITTDCYVDIESVVRRTVREIGYEHAKYGFDCDSCAVVTSIKGQSPDIALGVDKALEARSGESDESAAVGAGDQGMMFGFACNETPEAMPMPISLAHKLTARLAQARKQGELSYLRPDGKSQVTVEYENDKPKRISAIVVSTQHDPDVEHAQIVSDIKQLIISPVIPKDLLDDATRYYINPTGRFVTGGPQGDCGLTGRKIIVDTYGGYARHGGGSFSGKDPTKVDRSASYMTRHIAKNIVAAGVADLCEIEVAYAIGVAKPLSVYVNTSGTGKRSDEDIAAYIQKAFDLSTAGIIKYLDLRRPIYRQTASYGHFGRPEFSWEKLNQVDAIRAALL